MSIKRRKTRQIRIGNVLVGGEAPVSIQSMAKTDTEDIRATVTQIHRLERAGCEIIRVAVKDIGQAQALGAIKSKIKIPLEADIHFSAKLAVVAIEEGVDAIRLNPGNIKEKDVISIIRLAKKKKIPIRIGVNSGSVGNGPGPLADRMVNAAQKFVRIFEEAKFYSIIISMKASDVATTVQAYRKMSRMCDYPFHIGMTAAGPGEAGVIKNVACISALLLDGIGDTLRVSLTGDPLGEVIAGREILQSLGLRRFGPEIISCPTCGRCRVDLVKIVDRLEKKLHNIERRFLRVAVMGCEVNGPGEAAEADIGIACGTRSGVLFKHGKIIKRLKESEFVNTLMREINEME